MAKTRPSGPDRSAADGLTRYQVARQLGVGITTVLRMCARGELHPRPGAHGVWRYDPGEVIRVAAMRMGPGRRSAGQTAAAAFHMFDTGVEFKDCVILLQLSPGDVRRLYREWQSSFDGPPPEPESHGVPLLDEDPRAEEEFQRAMAQATALADPSIPLPLPKPKKTR
ncbi:MAG TPA: helix-turn-helix domain-containing protein [Polyangia bacterium]|nr:helix-turn-helix domain-containing protein [Polyangia bacterium]